MACCRSCLSTDRELHSLHKTSKDAFGISYMDCFQLLGCCPNDGASDTELAAFVAPTAMCEACLNELRVAFVFRQRCKQSLEELQDRFRRQCWEDESNGKMVIEMILVEDEALQETTEQNTFVKTEETMGVAEDESLNSIHNDENSMPHSPFSELETQEETHEYVEDVESAITFEEVDVDGSEEATKVAETEYLEGSENNDEGYDLEYGIEVELEQEQNIFEDSQSPEIVELKCQVCHEVFDDRLIYSNHMQTNHDYGANKFCNVCGLFLTSTIALKLHLLEHTNNSKPFVCDICSKSYISKAGLLNHMSIHSGGDIKPFKFLCSHCGKSFKTNQRLKLHAAIHSGQKNFTCNICEKSFIDEFKLRSHVRIHTGERPFHCNTCGLRFTQGNALKCHMRTHTGEKPYKCNFCDKSFTQNTILKTHMTLHTGKTVKCPDCDKKFSRPSYLILHRREHTGEKPYKCEHCPNRYKQKSHLDRHRDTHLGVKHTCTICGKEYSKAYTLKQHMLTHTESTSWPFQCKLCDKGYVRKDKYNVHMRMHANIKHERLSPPNEVNE